MEDFDESLVALSAEGSFEDEREARGVHLRAGG